MQTTKTKNGFTLLELLVSIGILVIVTTLVLVNYRTADKSSALRLEAHKIAGDLQRARSMALGSAEFNGSIPGGGWGISYSASANNYVLFADDNSNAVYNAPGELYQTINLENNITFSSSAGNITFVPPDPTIYLDEVSSGEKTITLTDGTNTKDILVNFLGLIDVGD